MVGGCAASWPVNKLAVSRRGFASQPEQALDEQMVLDRCVRTTPLQARLVHLPASFGMPFAIAPLKIGPHELQPEFAANHGCWVRPLWCSDAASSARLAASAAAAAAGGL